MTRGERSDDNNKWRNISNRWRYDITIAFKRNRTNPGKNFEYDVSSKHVSWQKAIIQRGKNTCEQKCSQASWKIRHFFKRYKIEIVGTPRFWLELEWFDRLRSILLEFCVIFISLPIIMAAIVLLWAINEDGWGAGDNFNYWHGRLFTSQFKLWRNECTVRVWRRQGKDRKSNSEIAKSDVFSQKLPPAASLKYLFYTKTRFSKSRA